MDISDLFHYKFLDGKLIGSENPNVFGEPVSIVKEMCRRYGIRHLVTLSSEYDEFEVSRLQRYHIPVEKLPTPRQMITLFSIIDKALDNNEPIWMHCQGGIDRTGSVIGAYLVSKGHDSKQIIKQLQQKFSARLRNYPLDEIWSDYSDFIMSYQIMGCLK